MKKIFFAIVSSVVFVSLSSGSSFGINSKPQADSQNFFKRNAKSEACSVCNDQAETLKADSSPWVKNGEYPDLAYGVSIAYPYLCNTQLSEKKLIASDTGANDGLGISSAISGDYAIIGAPFHQHTGGAKAGAAYIFKKEGNAWVQQAELLQPAPGGDYDDEFGWSVSISGDYVIVGAPLYGLSSPSRDRGTAYIFQRQGAQWLFQQQLYGTNLQEWDRYGISVSISGDYAVVGSDLGTGTSNNSGNVHVFKRNGSSWVLQAIIFGNDAFGSCGHSVSIAGDYIVMGAPDDDDNGTQSGSAYIFKREGTNWTQQAKLLPTDGSTQDYFGNSVSIFGDNVIVGAWGDDDMGLMSGSAYIFKRNGTAWNQQQKIVAEDGAAIAAFGTSVSMGETYAIIGAPDRYYNSIRGAAYIYKKGTSSWSHKRTLVATDTATNPYFGQGVSVSGSDLAVGASEDNFNTAGSGAAYYYKICNGSEYMPMD